MAATTDYVLTVSDRAAMALATSLRLRIMELPLPLSPYALNLLWHPRLENEPANRWLREVFVRAAKKTVPDAHADARRKLVRAAPPSDGSKTPVFIVARPATLRFMACC